MIKYLTPDLYDDYETFISKHSKGHFVKSIKWLQFKNPWKYEILISVDDNNNIRGSMLILFSKVPRTKCTHMYCPRGPVVDDDDVSTLNELCNEAKKLAKEHNAYCFSTDPDITDADQVYLNNLKAAGFVVNNTKNRPEYLHPLQVFRLYLNGKTEDEVFADFHSKTRYNVRLSERKGVTCRIGTKEDLPAFHKIMIETAARDGFMARSLKYFEDMYDALSPENLRLYLIEYEGQIISGAVAIYYGDKLWYLYGASSNRERNRMPNYMMQWEMIKWSIEKNCNIYDFRGVMGDVEKSALEGLVRFKQGFGSEQVDFVGKLDMLFMPITAKIIENGQTTYRAFVRKLGVWKRKLKK